MADEKMRKMASNRKGLTVRKRELTSEDYKRLRDARNHLMATMPHIREASLDVMKHDAMPSEYQELNLGASRTIWAGLVRSGWSYISNLLGAVDHERDTVIRALLVSGFPWGDMLPRTQNTESPRIIETICGRFSPTMPLLEAERYLSVRNTILLKNASMVQDYERVYIFELAQWEVVNIYEEAGPIAWSLTDAHSRIRDILFAEAEIPRRAWERMFDGEDYHGDLVQRAVREVNAYRELLSELEPEDRLRALEGGVPDMGTPDTTQPSNEPRQVLATPHDDSITLSLYTEGTFGFDVTLTPTSAAVSEDDFEVVSGDYSDQARADMAAWCVRFLERYSQGADNTLDE